MSKFVFFAHYLIVAENVECVDGFFSEVCAVFWQSQEFREVIILQPAPLLSRPGQSVVNSSEVICVAQSLGRE